MNLKPADFKKLKLGVFVMDKASSAATIKAHSIGFAFGKNIPVMMQIEGSEGALVGPYTGFKSEIVFNKGTRIEITEIKDTKFKGNKMKLVKARYVGRA